MILLLGSTGYIGQAFATALRRRRLEFKTLSRSEVNYTRFGELVRYLRKAKPAFLINAAGYTGKPNVDACETQKTATLQGNSLFPQVVAAACLETDTPWGHVSSGCIFSGAKVIDGGLERVEKDLSSAHWRQLFEERPEQFRGFDESDAPNFSFDDPPCSFYSGTKALGEQAIRDTNPGYIWRLRIPFDQFDNSRNYLSKIQRYAKVYDNINSLSHRSDFVEACLDLWDRRAPFGIYNVTNPGAVSTRQVVAMMQKILKPARKFEFWENDDEFYRYGAKTPRSNCILDASRLAAVGVVMRPVSEALEESLRCWQSEKS